MKLALASDIHGKYNFKWPKADVLVLAGDLLPNLSRVDHRDVFMQKMWIQDTFAPAMHSLLGLKVYKHIVIIPGNHDKAFRYEEKAVREILSQIAGSFHCLIDQQVTIDGKVFHGSPMTPWFGGDYWVYNFPDHRANMGRYKAHAQACWDLIPDDVEVLITHGPPEGILSETWDGTDAGCKELKKRVCELEKLKLHVFGHIHEGYGQMEWEQKLFVNAAVCTLQYKPTNPVQVVEI